MKYDLLKTPNVDLVQPAL